MLPIKEMICDRCNKYVSMFYCPVDHKRWCVYCTPMIMPMERSQKIMCPFCRSLYNKSDVQTLYQSCYNCGKSWGIRYVHIQGCMSGSKLCYSCNVEWPHKCIRRCKLIFVCDGCTRKEKGLYAVTNRVRVLERRCPKCNIKLAR